MIAVIFEVWPAEGRENEYFELAAALRADLERMDGFISIERFLSLSDDAELLTRCFEPDLTSFYWGDASARALASEIWDDPEWRTARPIAA